MIELPNGWSQKQLGEIADTQLGKMLNKSKQNDFRKVPYLRTDNVHWGRIDLNLVKEMEITPEERDKFIAQPGDLLICEGGASGRTAIWNLDYEIGIQNHLHRVRTRGEVSNKYLMYYMEWLVKNGLINHLIKGVTISHLSQSSLRSIVICYPGINEQHEIVELLENNLSRLDAALADVYSAKLKASQLKLAILSKVFTGEFFDFEMPILWIDEVAKVMNGDRGKNYPNKSARVESGVAFINAGHLDDDLLNIKDMDFISEERFNLLAAGKVEPDDLLFCLRGSLGKVAINDKFTNGAIASSLAILRVNPKVLPKYLYYYFLSPLAAAEIKKHDNGTAQPNLSAANLKKFEVPIPTIEQQKKVIDFLDLELSRAIQVSHNFESLFSTASAMRRSLLQSAFTGQLTKEVLSV
jgi:type I restriction enzyme S subunit